MKIFRVVLVMFLLSMVVFTVNASKQDIEAATTYKDIPMVAGGNSDSQQKWQSIALSSSNHSDANFPKRQSIKNRKNDYTNLIAQAEKNGRVPIIARLNGSFIPEGDLESPQSVTKQRLDINQAQTALLSDLEPFDVTSVKEFRFIPYIAFAVDAAGLDHLTRSPLVTFIEEDALEEPTLDISVPLINADDAWAAGFTGAGQTVAILDTGVDSSHPFLGGRVVSEACYSSGSYPLCPNGQNVQIGPGSAVNCDPIAIESGCKHGTHVAGIAAGNGASFDGVAPDANIIAIQVFHQNWTYCDGCVLSYNSDVVLGLEHVYDLRNTYNIAAANLSLGGGSYSDPCDTDSRKAIIDNLRSVDIATVISSGNNGYSDSISAPACISTAVSVGSTTSYNPADQIASYSNSAYFLDLLAPGSSINSSTPGGGFESWNGTSMAAPHVTGAWAVLKSQYPDASVDSILNSLKTTGVPITDARNGMTLPRIDVGAAVISEPPKSLTVTKEGTGNGLVSSDPAGISCGYDCSRSYAHGTSVTLTATPVTGSIFSGWNGGGCTGVDLCTVNMISDVNVTANFTSVGPSADILLVDDDDNAPDVRGYYTDVLDTLGLLYDTWDTNNSDNEPDAAYLSAYDVVIWFSGDAFYEQYFGWAGPGTAGENALGTWLENGNCLFISSQDYHYDHGPTSFMSDYLGVDYIVDDDGDYASISGQGAIFGGLGPYDLSYPFTDFADIVNPDISGEIAFIGDNSNGAAVFKDNGTYRTTFWAFPLEALATQGERNVALGEIVNWCEGDSPPYEPSLWSSDYSYADGWRTDKHVRETADVNNDDLADVIGFGSYAVFVSQSDGSSFGIPTSWIRNYTYGQGWRTDKHVRTVADVNGDGQGDIIGFGANGVFVSLSNGSSFGTPAKWSTEFGYLKGWRVEKHLRKLADVNGDDRADIIGFGANGVFVALSNGSSFNAPTKWSSEFGYLKGWTVDRMPREVADVDGDGMADIVGFGGSGTFVALSNGSSFGAPVKWIGDFGFNHGWTLTENIRELADVNNDGMADIVGFGDASVYAAISTGSNFGTKTVWTDDFTYDGGWLVDRHPRMLADHNGDGREDIAGFGGDGVYVLLSDGAFDDSSNSAGGLSVNRELKK